MGRPPKPLNDPTKKLAVGVSLTQVERRKLAALGGSKWLSAMLTAFPDNLQPVEPGMFLIPHGGILEPQRKGRLAVVTK